MIKRSHYLAFIIFCVVNASITFFVAADFFDELFKNVDFDQVAKDMEKVLGKQDEAAYAPEMEPIAVKGETSGGTGAEGVVIETPKQAKDTRTLFIDPDIQKVSRKGKVITEPTDQSREALAHFKDEMVEKLSNLELNVEANKLLSPQFKDKFLRKLRDEADKIIIAIEAITSKKVYEKIFLNPPEIAKSSYESTRKAHAPLQDSMKQIRQRVLTLIDKIDHLNKKIALSEEEETKEEDKARLEKLAGQERENIIQVESLTPIKPKVRGVKYGAKKPVKVPEVSEEKSETASAGTAETGTVETGTAETVPDTSEKESHFIDSGESGSSDKDSGEE